MSKNSDRARVEKNLEDMMDNDWRVFRAQLVAKEHAQATKDKQDKKHPTHHQQQQQQQPDEKLAKQGQLGDLFAGAISSIFSSRSNNNNKAAAAAKHDIFNGDTIGGALRPEDLEDPFVSADELPMLIKSNVRLDKHRWAHEISHVEPGSVLLANEKLGGVFHQTVVLIIEHSETGGSTGIVINRYVRLRV